MAKVKAIEYIGEEDVYNMEVESHHNYSVNGGLILHNCDAIRYFVAGRPKPTDKPEVNENPEELTPEQKYRQMVNDVTGGSVPNSFFKW